jgi:tetratricopeptide (TPR) repeat protein
MRQIITTLAVLFVNISLYGESIPWLEFRDAVFGQDISIVDAQRLFQEAVRLVGETPEDSERYVVLSRCEYLMGRVYQDHGRKDEAIAHFEKGINLAEMSLSRGSEASAPVKAQAYEMIATNIGQLCMLRSTVWVMANGSKVEENAKKARQLDSQNAGSLYLLASRWAFGPGIFGDPKRGIAELEAILGSQAVLQRDNYFNVYSALAYANLRMNRNHEALSWVQKSIALYPSNKFALDLQSQIQQKLK